VGGPGDGGVSPAASGPPARLSPDRAPLEERN